MESVHVAVLQMVSGDDLDHNLAQAAAEGAEFALLPEYFYLMPEDERARVALAAPVSDHPLLAWAQGLAWELGIWLLAGTLPLESNEPGKMHNSSLLIDPQGQLASRYDKLHLFGFCTGQEQYDEAATMSPGREVVSHPLPWGGGCASGSATTCASPSCFGLALPPISSPCQRHSPTPPGWRTGSCCCGPGRWRIWPSCWPQLRGVSTPAGAAPSATA